jgi:hypothetical protein
MNATKTFATFALLFATSAVRLMRVAFTTATLVLFLYQLARTQTFDANLMKQSSVIVVGTITKLGSATFPDVPISHNTSIIKIEQVLQKPAAISISAGDEITLELQSGTNVGARATFYADGWILGKGIALREIGRTPLAATTDTAQQTQTRKTFHETRRQIIEANIRARIDSADIVALGKVISIQPSTPEAHKRITEHEPNWQDAVVKVSKGLKGVADGAEVVVRFPASMDVAFYGMPKFNKGDERVMVLRTDTRSGLLKAMVAGKEVNAYMIEKPSDVLEKERWQQVMEIMKRR